MNKTILVVDDDPELRQLLRDHLGAHGYDVLLAADGKEMWQRLGESRADLVVLDLMLPGDDGLTLCRDLRARTALPVLMLSARGDEMDRVIGLEVGADDYIAKPFSPRELLARIKSILRRVGEIGRKETVPERQLPLGDWLLDLDARYLINPESVVVSVSSGEFKLLKLFAENPNRVLSRDQLLEVLAGREAGPYDRTVDVMVSRLRRRLGDDGREPALIKTVRSEGYLLVASTARQS
jgi:two-component system OmpR family response regulator